MQKRINYSGMDAQYLKKNINDALVEALASMAISLPEDGVEYIGKYLIQYVDRQEQHKNVTYPFDVFTLLDIEKKR